MANKNYDIQISAVEKKIQKLQLHLEYLKNLKQLNEGNFSRKEK